MSGLENECKRSFELFDNGLDKLGESEVFVRIAIPDIFAKNGDRLSIGLTLELVTTLLQHLAQFSGVGDDTVVNNNEFATSIRAKRMAVDSGRRSMGGPASVGNRAL